MVLLLVQAAPALANDAGLRVEGGEGGAIRLLSEHPLVAMRSERIRVELGRREAEVSCTFVFVNTGTAPVTVVMGFPETAHVDLDCTDPAEAKGCGFTWFRSTVDGKTVAVSPSRWEVDKGKRYSTRWRVKRVRFGPRQTRTVVNTYRVPHGYLGDRRETFRYRLDTGASWKGPIRSVEVVVVSRVGRIDGRWRVSPAPARRTSASLSWSYQDLEPRPAHNISIGIPEGL